MLGDKLPSRPPRRDGARDRVARLCREHEIISRARQRTRYAVTDRIDDAEVLERLFAFIDGNHNTMARQGHPDPLSAEDDILAATLATEATRMLRESLVTTLTDTYGFSAVVAEACERVEIVGREDQLAYCLVLLCQRRDPERLSADGRRQRTTYLDVGGPGFADRLRDWSGTVAGHLRAWASVYDAIQTEAERYEIATLRSLIRIDDADDVVSVLADKLSSVLAEGQRLTDMSLVSAISFEPTGREYVFQTPLPRWVATIANRSRPTRTSPLDPHDVRPDDSATSDDDENMSALRENDFHRGLVERVADLAATRDLLPAAVDSAETLDRNASRIQLSNPDDSALFQRVRAELTYVVDELRKEQRAFGAMLAYILLAMRPASKRQLVAILSLRKNVLDDRVTKHIATRMRALVDGNVPPTPALIGRCPGVCRTS
jgi:hypothetical protein